MSTVDFSNVLVTPDWKTEFGLWLRKTPTQKRRERKHLSIDAYERDVMQMAAWFEKLNGCEFSPSDLNNMDLKSYFGQVENISAPATYNRKRASMRMLVKWAMSVGALEYDPSEWIPVMDATRESPRDVNDDERMMLELAAEENESTLIGMRDSVIFFLMSNVGLRISEVVGLKLSDLDLEHGRIHVHGKGDKHRKPIIGGRTLEKVNAWLERMPKSIEGNLVTDERGLSIERGQAWRRFCLIAERAGVKTTPHAMRHTFVLRFMDAMMDGDPSKLPAAIDAVCQQTGDRPEVILAYYTRARESDIRAAAEVM